MGKTPRPSRPALEILEGRERRFGIALPASLKEFYSLRGAAGILEEHSDSDVAVPIGELGDPEELEHGVIRIQDDGQGMGAWYVRLDGSDDPPVELQVEGDEWLPPEGADDWSWWDVAKFERVADRFSEFIYQRVFEHGFKGDRKVAARLKPYGGRLEFDDAGRAVEADFHGQVDVKGSPRVARPLDALAMGLLRRLVHLRRVHFSHPHDVAPSCWANLRGHPGLLSLKDAGVIGDDAVEDLIALPALREMVLVGERLTDRGLDRLLRGHPFIELSIVLDDHLTAAGLAALSAQAGLERLRVGSRKSALTDEAMASLSGAKSIRRLAVESKTPIRGGLRHLAGLRQLEHLELYLPGMTDDDLLHLGGLTNLTGLRLAFTDELTGHGLRHLSRLGGLRSLDLGGLPIEDEALAHLAPLEGLETLRLHASRVAGPGLRHLSGLTRLRELDLGGSRLVDEGMPHLARLHSLEWLSIAHTRITDDGLRQLAPIRNIAYLCLDGSGVSLAAIRDIRPDRAR